MSPSRDHGAFDGMSDIAGGSPSAEVAVEGLRHRVASVRFPLRTSDAVEACSRRDEILEQIDDHMLPRLRRLDAPLLVVVGGSTGAGKSTLVNSLTRGNLAETGVRRPTTRLPVVVCNPADRSYFVGEHANLRGTEPGAVPAESEELPPGLALLDTPDIDSVVNDNRELATRLIALADLWLYVTTATRYADAVPWDLLRSAVERGTVLAVTLNRVPRAGGGDVREHLAQLLVERGFGTPPLFVVPESSVTDGKLPAEAVKNLQEWLADLAGEGREPMVRGALGSLLEGFRRRVPALAKHVETQIAADGELRDDVEASYTAALAGVDESTRDSSLLRGEVLIRWQDFVGSGELARSLRARAGWLSSKIGSRQGGDPNKLPPGGAELREALARALAAEIRSAAETASEGTVRRWRARPAGAALLDEAGHSRLVRPERRLRDRADRIARDWQENVLELVRSEGATKRSVARVISADPEKLTLVLMVGLLGYEATEPPGGESGMLPRRLLRSVFGAESLRTVAEKARQDLRRRVGDVFDEDAARFIRLVEAADAPDDAAVTDLYQVIYTLEVAR